MECVLERESLYKEVVRSEPCEYLENEHSRWKGKHKDP